MNNLRGLQNLRNLASGRILDPLSGSRGTRRLRSGVTRASRTAVYRATITRSDCGRMK